MQVSLLPSASGTVMLCSNSPQVLLLVVGVVQERMLVMMPGFGQ